MKAHTDVQLIIMWATLLLMSSLLYNVSIQRHFFANISIACINHYLNSILHVSKHS